MPARTILFDLDGTISDPREGITNAALYALRKLKLPPIEPKQILRMIGPPLHTGLHRYCGIPESQTDEGVRLYREYYFEKGWSENALYNGMREILSTLPKMGHTLAVATFKPENITSRILKHFDIDHYFTDITGAERSTDGTKTGIINHLLEKIGNRPEEAVMIGDRAADMEGARTTGVPFIGVTWGYAEEGELNGAKTVISEPAELLTRLP